MPVCNSLNRVFPGKVARFAGRVQPSTRTMDTEVDVPNPGLFLIPGMYAEVSLTLDRRYDARKDWRSVGENAHEGEAYAGVGATGNQSRSQGMGAVQERGSHAGEGWAETSIRD